MKQLIKINLKTRTVKVDECKTDLLVLGIFSDQSGFSKVVSRIDRKLGGAVKDLMKLGDFNGKETASSLLYANKKLNCKRVLLVGLGDKQKAGITTLRNAASNAANKAVSMKVNNMAVALYDELDKKLDLEQVGQAIAEGIFFGGYRYDEFVNNGENGRLASLNVEVINEDEKKLSLLNKGLKKGYVIGESQCLARTLANKPANIMYPKQLAAEAKKLASSLPGLSCTVFDYDQLKKKKMGGIIAVGQGSIHKPCMIVMKYKPKTKSSKKSKVIGLVGKAITFDSGGISIKPAANMDAMKMDKSGGAAVLGVMKAVAQLKLPFEVYGIICAAENAPGGNSYRPGDIITTYSGKTVEILNTDAEGRIVLSDGIHYADQQNCDVIIDVATLTGACMVGLGVHKAGLMSNDRSLINELETASQQSGEPVWNLPCDDEYLEEMKSRIADLKNIGSKWGGACTAAAFLGQFAGKRTWAHLDIAGKMDPSEPQKKITSNGSIGFGVRLLTAYLMNLTKQ
jgi:leucyl aminopeptidase